MWLRQKTGRNYIEDNYVEHLKFGENENKSIVYDMVSGEIDG